MLSNQRPDASSWSMSPRKSKSSKPKTRVIARALNCRRGLMTARLCTHKGNGYLTTILNDVRLPIVAIRLWGEFMYRKLSASAMIAGWLFLSCGFGLSHHSVAANFDQSKTLDITGKVKEFEIRNPHSQLTLEVTKPDGSISEF